MHYLIGLSMLALLSAAQCHAGSLPFTPSFKAKEALSIPVTSSAGEASLDFPAMKQQAGQALCIMFKAFLVTPQPAGWNPYLQIRLNGKPLSGYMPDGGDRLLNRGQVCRTSIEGSQAWWDGETLLTFFGPPEGDLDPRVLSSREEGYRYVLNISDAASYVVLGFDDRVESAEPNRITFRNTYAALEAGETAVCREMRIEDVSVGYVPEAEIERLRPAGAKLPTELKGETLRGIGSVLTVAPSGAMQIEVGGERYLLASSFSYPSEVMEYNRFSWAGGGEPAWKPQVTTGRGSITVRAESAGYAVTRTVTSKSGKFRVRDTIENRTADPLGMSVQHELAVSEAFGRGDIYFAGNPDSNGADACAVNPTIFLRRARSSVGIVAEDNVLRLQLAALNRGNTARFGTEHFGLPPRESYTMEWTIYPSGSREYFDFINRVRRDWKVNFTIPGPFAFSDAEVAPGRNIRLYAIPPWFEYSTGSGTSREDFAKILKPKLEKFHAAQPDAISLGMIETNLIAVERAGLPGAEAIPAKPADGSRGTYGLELTLEQAKALRGLLWYDCMLKTADGRPLVDTYYADKAFFDLMVYPAEGNYQLEFMLGQIDYLMDVVGFRGVYLDQFTLAVRGLGQRDRCTFEKWDGRTVDLNERGEIARKYTDCALAGATARAAIVRHVLGKGGQIVTNGHSVTRETTGLRCLNFQETEWTAFSPLDHLRDEPPIEGDWAAGHLDSPIGLGIRPSRFGDAGREHWAEIIHKWIITGLKNGQLYCYYESRIPAEGPGSGEYGIMNHMFPFTPVELHSGWMVGRERIVTAVSGEFAWRHTEKPVCRAFDLRGRAITPNAGMRRNGGSWIVSLKLDDWNETAVISAE